MDEKPEKISLQLRLFMLCRDASKLLTMTIGALPSKYDGEADRWMKRYTRLAEEIRESDVRDV